MLYFYIFMCTLWVIVSLFMILIILLQRGRGGGLAGALGGMGGSSAFGTKAGDVFTRITIGIFAVWLLLAMILVWTMKTKGKYVESPGAGSTSDKTEQKDSKPIDLPKGTAAEKSPKGTEESSPKTPPAPAGTKDSGNPVDDKGKKPQK